MQEAAAWAILFLPLVSFLIIAFVIRPFLNQYSNWAGHLAALAIAGSLLLSLWALESTTGHHGEAIGWEPHTWMTLGDAEADGTGELKVRVGIFMDPLTAIMLVVVSGVSLLVQIYSQGYMRGDPGYARYFAVMSLFTASMLGLVMASSIIQLFLFWELVGLCSYLLIGFWYQRPSAARAAVKAFLVTRLGDLGLLVAILYLYFQQGSFGPGLNSLEIPDIQEGARLGLLGSAAITWVALGIFAGAVGKSAQFPLHVWLPDAMEGPTPVSALIHAATMVAAGVFLVARFFPVFEAAPDAMTVVAIIGGVTALFAATMGMVMYDIKRVVAYSTISQLGYMVMALGIGAYGAAIFHLFTHAFFKALLFLGAGSANHATGTFDMRYMGGLRRYQPWTYAAFILAALSLSGVFPLAGFWSKDEILAEAFDKGGTVGPLVFTLAIVAVFMTSFYIFRVLFMTFHGKFRGGVEAEQQAGDDSRGAQGGDLEGGPRVQESTVGAARAHDANDKTGAGHSGVHLAESPWVMVAPMLLLAVMAVVIGFIASPPFDLGPIPKHWMAHFLGGESPTTNLGIAVLSLGVALGGIGAAWLLYGARKVAPERVTIPRLHRLISRKYYIDDLYERLFLTRVFYRAGCGVLDWADRAIVDGIADLVGWFNRNIGRALAQLQTGQLQGYGVAITTGVAILAAAYLLWG